VAPHHELPHSHDPTPAQADIDPDLIAGHPHPAAVLAVVSLGGVLGAEARYGLGLLVTHRPGGFPVSTLVINATGALLLGALMALLALRRFPELTRPFVGVGIIGGYTTFSTFAVDAVGLGHRHHVALALVYVVSTVALCALTVRIGDWSMRAVLARSAISR
jgi:CrcB protein